MADDSTFSVSYPQPNAAVIAIDTPGRGANLLSHAVLDELAAILDELDSRPEIGCAIFLSKKPGVFIAGADVERLRENTRRTEDDIFAASQRGQATFARLSAGRFVSIAAIDGRCLGGGAELAFWCDGRIAAPGPTTEIGFPEVKLGLIPGWGGTAILPRLVGIGNAVDLIAGGEPLDAEIARKLDLIDDLAPRERLLDAAIALAERLRQDGEWAERRQERCGPLPIGAAELDFLAANARLQLARRPPGEREAALTALDTIIAAAGDDLTAACRRESQALAARFADPIAAALIHVFSIVDANKREAFPPNAAGAGTRKIAAVGILGAGIMGSGIAAAHLKQAIRVTIADANPEARSSGMQRAIEEASYDRQLRGPNPQRLHQAAARITACEPDSRFDNCDLVIEAVVENEDVKREILARLDEQLPPEVILASNTSTFPITSLARGLKHSQRFCGLHFFNPVRFLKLVEVIRGEATSDETIATAVAHARRLGKIPVVIKDGPGFLVNRVLFQFMNEALALLSEGATLGEIDRAAEDFGMAMGPCGIYDLVGMDTALFAGQTLWRAFPERTYVSPIVRTFIRAGRLGRKSGAGFFAYPNHSHLPQPDPAALPLIEQYVRTRRTFTTEEIQHRLVLPMLFEAVRVLADGIVRSPCDVDLGMIHGMGFPAHRGGLLYWADTLGPARILEMAQPFAAHGPRLQPPPLLLDMARTGDTFFPKTAP